MEEDQGDIEDLVHGVEVIEEQGNQVEDEVLPEFIIDEGDGAPKADEQMNQVQAAVAEPPELSWLKCAGHHHKGNTGSTHFKRNNSWSVG